VLDIIIADLISRFPSMWAAIVHLSKDLIAELERACEDAPEDSAAEAEYDREKPRLEALAAWAADRDDAGE
jgi:hypothetical protein